MKLLLHIAKFYSIPIFKPLIAYIEKEAGIDFVLYTSPKIKQVTEKEFHQHKNRVISTLAEGKSFNPDFCLSPSNYIDFRLPGIKVQLFHGLGLEKEAHFKIRHFFDVYFTSGPAVTERYKHIQKRHQSFLVYETGWLKIDHIIKYRPQGLKKRFVRDRDKKIILYAPTFSSKMESATDILPHLPQIIDDDELWLVKFHELMPQSCRDILTEIKDDKLRMVTAKDITPYLHLADIMVSDTSSVVYEFMVLDKPVITYRTAKRRDKGINISRPEQLRPALDKLESKPDLLSSSRKKHIKEVNPYLDGKTPERTITALRDIVDRNSVAGLRKPLNLGRKAKFLVKAAFGSSV